MGGCKALLLAGAVFLCGAGGAAGPQVLASSDQHSATFILSQEGLNNAPQLYSQLIAEAIREGNDKIKEPGYFCDTLDSVEGCDASRCQCEVRERPAWVRMFPANLRGTLPNGDIFKLKNDDASSVTLELLPAGKGYFGAVKFTALVRVGFKVPVSGYSLTGGGLFGLCCGGFIWAGNCDCRPGGHNCGCHHICDSPDVGISATTDLIGTVLLHYDTATGGVSATMDHCPSASGNCVDMPNLNDDMKIDRGCLGTMINRASNSKMLSFLAWITGGGSISKLADKMIQEQKDKLLPTINDWLQKQLPVGAPTTCGAQCNLPEGVEMSYRFAQQPMFFAQPGSSSSSRYIEAALDLRVCVQGMPDCFEARSPTTPPLAAAVGYRPGGDNGKDVFPSDAPLGSGVQVLTGVRISSSFVNGITWAMGRAGRFATYTNTTALDANLTFNVSWANLDEPPNVTVPAHLIDRLSFQWPHGFVRVVCASLPAHPDMMDFRWTHLLGNGTFNSSLGGCNPQNLDSCECGRGSACGPDNHVCSTYTDVGACHSANNPEGRCVWNNGRCLQNTCVYLQVTKFDTSRSELQLISPKLPLPNELVTKAMEAALIEGKGELNTVLKDSSVCQPEQVAQYLTPPPSVTLYPQDEHPGHGFIELVSYCGGANRQPCMYKGSATPAAVAATVRRSSAPTLPSPSGLPLSPLRLSKRDQCQSQLESCHRSQRISRLETSVCENAVPAECGAYLSQQSIDARSTYSQGGRRYYYGAFIIATTECKFSCAAKQDENSSVCQPTYFQDGVCQDSVVRSCDGETYSEVSYLEGNCSGTIISNETRPQMQCTSAEVGSVQLFFSAVCPRLAPEEPTVDSPTGSWGAPIAVSVSLVCLCIAVLVSRYWCRDWFLATAAWLHSGLQSACAATRAACERGWLRAVPLLSNVADACKQSCVSLLNCISPTCRWCVDSGRTTGMYLWRRTVRAANSAYAVCKFVVFMRPRSCRQFVIHDWVDLSLNCLAAVGYILHGLLWMNRDPFEAFDRNVFREVGLDKDTAKLINVADVQMHFRQWSYWGQRVQAAAAIIIGFAVLVGLIEQISPMRRVTVSSLALWVVATGQVSTMLAPPFFFDLSLTVNDVKNESYSRLVGDPEFRHEADAALSLAFDGVALTFISSLYMFLLHGLAPGVFLGSCVFGAHLIHLHHTEEAGPFPPTETDTLSQPLIRQSAFQLSRAAAAKSEQATAPSFLEEKLAAAEERKNVAYAANEFDSLPALQAEVDRIASILAAATSSGTPPAVTRLSASVGVVSSASRDDEATGSGVLSRGTFTEGATLGSLQSWREDWVDPSVSDAPPMSQRLLQQQQPRVRIINWIVALGAPCGGCLPVIIVYQSLGAEAWWAGLWLACWILPTCLMWPLIQALKARGRFGWGALQLAGTAGAYILLYGSLTIAILLGLLEKARQGGFAEFTIEFPLSTFVSTVIGSMALTNNYLQRALLLDATRQHMANQMLEKAAGRLQQTTIDEVGRETARDTTASDANGDGDNDMRDVLAPPARPSVASLLDAHAKGTALPPTGSCQRRAAIALCTCLGKVRSCRCCPRRSLHQATQSLTEAMPASAGELYVRYLQPPLHWLIEKDERRDPRHFGRRLPGRRISLALGTCLTAWVMREDYYENEGFTESFVLENVKGLLERVDSGLQWPEGNATVLDEAFDTYGDCLRVEFLMLCLSLTLLCCACWCDWFVRDHAGLRFSRTFGFLGLALMFVSSLVPAGPNYLHISRMDTLCPCCAQRFNFLVTTLLQDMVGIACSGLFAFKLLPVLLVVVPSMVRACTLILADDVHTVNRRNRKIREAVPNPVGGSHQSMRDFSVELHSQRTLRLYSSAVQDYGDPAFSRSNVHSVLAMVSVLTPVFTAIPITVLLQLLRRPAYNTHHYDFELFSLLGGNAMSNLSFLSLCMGVFYFCPICLGMLRCNTLQAVEGRYALWMLCYFGPLIAVLVHEAVAFGFWEDVKQQMKEPITYLQIACEVLIANVILSDIMYSNLYVERGGSGPSSSAKRHGRSRSSLGADGDGGRTESSDGRCDGRRCGGRRCEGTGEASSSCPRVYGGAVLCVVPLVLCGAGVYISMDILGYLRPNEHHWWDPSSLHLANETAKEYPHAANGHPCPWEQPH